MGRAPVKIVKAIVKALICPLLRFQTFCPDDVKPDFHKLKLWQSGHCFVSIIGSPQEIGKFKIVCQFVQHTFSKCSTFGDGCRSFSKWNV